MNSRFPIKTKIAGLVITTFLLIVLALSLYLFVVIKNNEREIVNRSFRTLVQIGKNIKSKNTTYVKNIVNNTRIPNTKTETTKIDDNISEEAVMRVVKGKEVIYKVNASALDAFYYTNIEDSVKKVPADVLFNDVLGETVFDAFIIRSEDSTVIFNSLNLDLKLNQDSKPDSSVWKAGEVDLVKIGAIDYMRFTLPLRIGESEWWFMDGLIQNDKFQNDKKSLGTWFIIVMFTLLVFIVLSFPVLRLFLMGAIEQMHRSNLFYAGTSIIFGSSLVTILLISMLSNNYIQNTRKQQLVKLAHSVESEFVNEINSIYKQIKYYDSLNTVEFYKDVLTTDSVKYRPEIYPFFKTIFWMDAYGMQLQDLHTRLNYRQKLVKLDYRDYFKQKDAWELPGFEQQATPNRFMIESIYSNTTGEALAAVSTRSNGEKTFISRQSQKKTSPVAVAMTSPMYSVMDPVLPKGFKFCIIDSKGKVWFHSDKRRNLQENLLEECSRKDKLRSAIYSRTAESIHLNYQNKDYRIFVKPIQNIPLFLVSMQESSLTNSYNSTIVTVSFLFVIVFLVFIGIQVFILKLTDREETKLKRKKFTLDWLLPQKEKVEGYKEIIVGHFLVLISLILFFIFGDAEMSLFDVLFVFLYVQIFMTEKARLKLKSSAQKIKMVSIPFFRSAKIDGFSIIAALFVLIINIFHAVISKQYIESLLFEFWILVLLFFPFTSVLNKLFKNENEKNASAIPDSSKYILNYQLFLISWLFIISFLPSIVFFVRVVQSERKINRKYQEYYLSHEFQNRNDVIDNYYIRNNIDDTGQHFYRNNRKNKGIYTEFAGIKVSESIDPPTKTKARWKKMENSFSDTLLLNLRPLYTADIIESRNFIFNNTTDLAWKWKEKDLPGNSEDSDSLVVKFHLTEIQANDSTISKPYLISAAWPQKTILDGYGIYTLLFWSLLLLFILFLYKLMGNVLGRIFPFGRNSGKTRMPFKQLLKTVSEESDLPAFIYAVNLSGKDPVSRKKEAENYGFKCIAISYENNNPDEFKNGDKVVILNFGFVLRSLVLFDRCTSLLENLIKNNVEKIIISSYITPKQINDFYKNYVKNSKDDKEQHEVASGLNRFNQLLIDFTIFNCSLQPVQIEQKKNDKLSELVKNELEKDVFLASLQPLVLKYCQDNKPVGEDDVLLYIQNLAMNFYEKIWNSCNIDEKILLYDLAKDSLVNIKNNDTYLPLRNLQEKGIVVCDDRFYLMNRSFNNYILMNVNNAELENTEIVKERKTAWNSFRIPLVLFASGIVIFLFATQQALISNLYTLLIAVGAIAGVFIRISGMFSAKSKPAGEIKDG